MLCECSAKNDRLACFLRILQEIDLENRKTGRKRPRLLEHRRKLGQIDVKNARNLKKALMGRENGARIEFFKISGQNAKNRPASPEKITRKFCQNLPKFAKFCKNRRKSAEIGENTLSQYARTPPKYDHTLISPDEHFPVSPNFPVFSGLCDRKSRCQTCDPS